MRQEFQKKMSQSKLTPVTSLDSIFDDEEEIEEAKFEKELELRRNSIIKPQLPQTRPPKVMK